jgi:ribosomal protein L10
MSKYVKNLIARELARRLAGVDDALLVNVVGLDANQTVGLRRHLREKSIHLMVVKNSVAKRATEGSPLGAGFQDAEGPLAVVWGGEDFVSLVKEVNKLHQNAAYEAFQARGGVMDGEKLTPQRVAEISKWPGRPEQLSILAAQILSPGARLAAQLLAPGAILASQIEKKSLGEQGVVEQAAP